MLIWMDEGKKTTKVESAIVLRQKSRWRSWHRSIVCPGHSEGCSPPIDAFYRKTASIARYISFAVLLAIIVVIGALFYKVMIGFFVPVFLAAVLVVL